MINKTLIVTFIGISLFFMGCDSSSSAEEFNDRFSDLLDDTTVEELAKTSVVRKEVNDTYAIQIPSDLTMTTSLNDDASLQYNNVYSEKYIIVIDEDKALFEDAMNEADLYDDDMSLIGNFAEIQLSSFSEGVTIISQSNVVKTKVNGLDAHLYAFDARIEGIDFDISYWIGYIVGSERLYSVMAWTLESLKGNYESEANAILKSLEEL